MAVFAHWKILSAWTVFFATYSALAIGYVPLLRLDRTGAAFVGAVAFVFVGVLSSHEAFLAQDYETLVLLFSMMLIVSFLVNSGILGRLAEHIDDEDALPRQRRAGHNHGRGIPGGVR